MKGNDVERSPLLRGWEVAVCDSLTARVARLCRLNYHTAAHGEEGAAVVMGRATARMLCQGASWHPQLQLSLLTHWVPQWGKQICFLTKGDSRRLFGFPLWCGWWSSWQRVTVHLLCTKYPVYTGGLALLLHRCCSSGVARAHQKKSAWGGWVQVMCSGPKLRYCPRQGGKLEIGVPRVWSRVMLCAWAQGVPRRGHSSQGEPGQPPLSHPCLSALLGRAPWHWEGTAGGVGLPHCLEKGLLVLAHGSAISYLPELKEFYWVSLFFCTEDACAWYFTWEQNQEFTYPCKRPLVMNKLPWLLLCAWGCCWVFNYSHSNSTSTTLPQTGHHFPSNTQCKTAPSPSRWWSQYVSEAKRSCKGAKAQCNKVLAHRHPSVSYPSGNWTRGFQINEPRSTTPPNGSEYH